MKELILFIAYKACSGKDLFGVKNSFQHQNATILIAVLFGLHIIQIIMLTTNYLKSSYRQIEFKGIAIYFVSFIILTWLSSVLFSRRVLAKAIKRYKNKDVGEYAKLIAFGYFTVNVVAVILIAVFVKS